MGRLGDNANKCNSYKIYSRSQIIYFPELNWLASTGRVCRMVMVKEEVAFGIGNFLF
jgi:hypothetical protein